MSQHIREQLSALMDGELPRDETKFLLRRIEHDRGLVQRWSNYHVLRQALRRQELAIVPVDFSEAILARIESDAAPALRSTGKWLRWASGGAIAASVAVVALLFSGPRGASDDPAGEPLAKVPAPSTTTSAIPASSRSDEFRPPMISPALDVQPASASTAGFGAAPTPIDPRLQSYLIRHYDAAGNAGQAGVIPYVLLIVPSQQQAVTGAAEKAVEQR